MPVPEAGSPIAGPRKREWGRDLNSAWTETAVENLLRVGAVP